MNVEEVRRIVLLCEASKLLYFKFSNGESVVEFNKKEIVETKEQDDGIMIQHSDINTDDKLMEISMDNFDEEFVDIKSSFVGIVLLDDILKNPGEEIKVKKDSVLCSVEAMKIYNDVKAPLDGTVVEVLVKDGEFVEFNQVLFKVRSDEVIL